MTVPPALVTANRAELKALIASNLLGQNTAAIAAIECNSTPRCGTRRGRDTATPPPAAARQ
ncbi:PPE domain-containing protein [Mycobacterium tuberculosis]